MQLKVQIMKSVSDKNENQCYGCGLCAQICPKHCIKMVQDNRGFLVPEVDESKCIDCGACLKKCPYNQFEEFNSIKKCYAAITKDNEIIKQSTSGGIFFEISKKCLEKNGVVYGVGWNSLHINYLRITSVKELEKIMTSKYIQSEIKNTYIEVKQDLDSNKQVIFSGTACQISGLYSYLSKKYDNLLTIEVACHGVPSIGLFEKYIKWLENNANKKVVKYKFRNKNKHKTGEHYQLKIVYDDGTTEYRYSNEDPYYASFLAGKTLRKTCYSCMFKGSKRISDITLCDFWGIEKFDKKFPAYNGSSAVIINTNKGLDLFNSIKNNLLIKETTFQYICKKNTSLISSVSLDKSINYDIDDKQLIEKLVPKKCLKNRLKNIIPDKLKYFIKRL